MTDTMTATTPTRSDHHCDIQDDRIGPVRLVRVVGRLDWYTAGELRDLMRDDMTDPMIIVNLDRAELDSTGTGMIMAAAVRARKRGQTLAFVMTNPIEVEVLESLGLPFLAPIVQSEGKALTMVGIR